MFYNYFMKYIYVVNHFNLKNRTQNIIRSLENASEKFNREYEIVINDTVEQAKSISTKYKDTEYIITAIGGDGSINLLLNDIVDTNNILSYIPIGTGNDFYRASIENPGSHQVTKSYRHNVKIPCKHLKSL